MGMEEGVLRNSAEDHTLLFCLEGLRLNKGLLKEDKFPKLQLLPRSGWFFFPYRTWFFTTLLSHRSAGGDHAEQHPPTGAGLMHSSAGFNATKYGISVF